MKKLSLLFSMLLMAVMASAATTIYIDKSSVGNIYAWDSNGNYGGWPGVALTTLDVATVNDVEYYTFVYTHEASGEGLIFNYNGQQTGDLTPQDGAIYTYTGGNTVSIETGEPDPDPTPEFDATQRKFAVTGDAFGGWSMPPTAAQTFTNNGDGTYTLVYEGASAAQFKLSGVGINDVFDTNWSVFNGGAMGKSGLAEGDNELSTSFGTGNMSFPVSGDVTLTISEVTENSCKLNITVNQEIIPDKAYYLVGGFNGWAAKDENYKFAENNGVFTLTETMSGEFKVIDENGNWLGGGDKTLTAADNTVSVTSDLGGNIILEEESEYTFTIENGVLTVTGFPAQPGPQLTGVYLFGAVGDQGWNELGQLTDNNPNFKLVDFEVEAGLKFKLVATYDDDEINVWYGAAGQNDFLVNESMLNTPITMGAGNEFKDLYFEKGGTFTFNFNVETLKLTITGEFEPDPVPQITGVHLFGAVGDADWANLGELTENEGVYTLADKDVEAGLAFKVVVSYDIAEDAWYGAQTDGAEFLVNANMLDVDITMGIDTEETNFENLYFEKAGQFTFAFTMGEEAATLKITGEFIPETKVLTGTVRGEDNQPIAGVTVTAVAITDEPQGIIRAEGQPLTTVTNDEGTFELKVPADANYNVTFAKDGYVTQTVGEDAIENVVLVESTPTGIASLLANGNVASVSYVNVSGSVSDKPFDGMNIVVVTYNDGSRQVAKVVK
jgi:hypothetical protein